MQTRFFLFAVLSALALAPTDAYLFFSRETSGPVHFVEPLTSVPTADVHRLVFSGVSLRGNHRNDTTDFFLKNIHFSSARFSVGKYRSLATWFDCFNGKKGWVCRVLSKNDMPALLPSSDREAFDVLNLVLSAIEFKNPVSFLAEIDSTRLHCQGPDLSSCELFLAVHATSNHLQFATLYGTFFVIYVLLLLINLFDDDAPFFLVGVAMDIRLLLVVPLMGAYVCFPVFLSSACNSFASYLFFTLLGMLSLFILPCCAFPRLAPHLVAFQNAYRFPFSWVGFVRPSVKNK